MDIRNANDFNTNTRMLFLLLFLITLSRYNLQIGFSLKPYMIFLFVMFSLNLASFYFTRLYGHEIALLAFYFLYSLSGALSIYAGSSLRIILGITLVLCCYFIMKSAIGNYSRKLIETAIGNSGLLFNLVSLILYLIGLQSLHFQFSEHEISAYGVLIDRGYPRLIGLLDDPNIYVFYNTIFLLYFLCNSHSLKNKCGLALSITTSVLTFSRGGLIALLLVFVIYLLMSKPGKQLKLMFHFTCFLSITVSVTTMFMKFDIMSILNQRIEDFQEDRGSGRFELWNRAIEYFIAHPFMGIGAFNFSEYNFFFYGEKLYVHNTFIEILAESGVIAFCVFLIFLFLVAQKLITTMLYKEAPYLFLTFIAFLLQMASLSLIVNEMFFVYLAILCKYFTLPDLEE